MLPAGLLLFGLAAAVGWSAGPSPATNPGTGRRWWSRAAAAGSWVLSTAGSVLLLVEGALAVVGRPEVLSVGIGIGPSALRTDPVSGLFLLIAFGVAIPITLAGAASIGRPRLGAAVALTLAAMVLVFTADNLFAFLFGWELLTVAFYLLTGYDRDETGRAVSSIVTVVFGKASGAALLVGGLLLVADTGSYTLSDLGGAPDGGARQVAYALLLLGFGVKVGLLPVQIWLPRGYANAPGPARAVMAGAAVNVGFYGMWRTLQILGAPPVWLVVVVLLLAGISAVIGIAHAAVHADLRYVIAWSSVENAGVITAGYAAALVGAAGGQPLLVAAGLLAATMQVIAHAMGKSLLFVATAAVEKATGSTDLDRIRGIARQLPWAGTGLVVGSMTLAGLPLTAGFAAEWLTLEALMQQFRIDDLPLQLSMAAAGALVALSVGIAGFTFVRLVSLTALGRPSEPIPAAAAAVDRAVGHRAGIAALIIGCLGLAALAPLEVRVIAAGLTPMIGDDADTALASDWVLQPVYADFSALSPTLLWIVIPALTVLVGVTAAVLSGRRLWRVRTVPAWSSASPGVDRGVGYTSFGYANPVRKVLANLLQTRGELHRTDPAPTGAAADGATDPNVQRDHTAASIQLGYTVDVVEVVEKYLYRPAAALVLRVARQAKRLQSGRLDAYIAYMLLALVAVLAVVTAIS